MHSQLGQPLPRREAEVLQYEVPFNRRLPRGLRRLKERKTECKPQRDHAADSSLVPYTLSRTPLRRRAPVAWLARVRRREARPGL